VAAKMASLPGVYLARSSRRTGFTARVTDRTRDIACETEIVARFTLESVLGYANRPQSRAIPRRSAGANVTSLPATIGIGSRSSASQKMRVPMNNLLIISCRFRLRVYRCQQAKSNRPHGRWLVYVDSRMRRDAEHSIGGVATRNALGNKVVSLDVFL
jgi:hypothetical protein